MTEEATLPVYQTMVTPHPETIPALTGWRKPRTAYILFEIPQLNVTSNGSSMGKGIFTLNAEARPDIKHHVDMALNDGARVIDYGNFPKSNDRNPSRAQMVQLHSGKSGGNPWDELERYVLQKMDADLQSGTMVQGLLSEVDALKAKLAEQEKKLEAKAEKPEKVEVSKTEKPVPARDK